MKDTLKRNEPRKLPKTKLIFNVTAIFSILHTRKPNDLFSYIVMPKPRIK